MRTRPGEKREGAAGKVGGTEMTRSGPLTPFLFACFTSLFWGTNNHIKETGEKWKKKTSK